MALTPLSPDLAWLLTDLEQLSQVPRFQTAELTLPCLEWGNPVGRKPTRKGPTRRQEHFTETQCRLPANPPWRGGRGGGPSPRPMPVTSGLGNTPWVELLLTSVDSGIKEVANVCNQSLMKLVTPEDDEPDEPKPVAQRQVESNPDDSLAKQEGTASGE